MPKRTHKAVKSAFYETGEAIVGCCNLMLLRHRAPLSIERLFAGEIGGEHSYLHSVLLPALSKKGVDEDTLLLISVGTNMAIWQAIMRGIVPRLVMNDILTSARLRGWPKASEEVNETKRQIVADTLAVGMGKELYVHPHNSTYLFIPNPDVRRRHMLQSLMAIAHLAVKAGNASVWMRTRLIAELSSWQRDIDGGAFVVPLIGKLKQGVQKEHIRMVKQLVDFARVDSAHGGTDMELSCCMYDTPPSPGQQTATNLIVPERNQRKVVH